MKGVDILYNYCWRIATTIPKYHAYCTKRHGSQNQVYQATAVEYQSLRGWQYLNTVHSSESLAWLAHAQDLSAFQLVILFNVWQGLSAQLGSMKPFFQVFALGFGGELTLRILTPHDVLLTLPTEMNFLLNNWGWKVKKFFRKKKKKKKRFELLEQEFNSSVFIILIKNIHSFSTCFSFFGIRDKGPEAGRNRSAF